MRDPVPAGNIRDIESGIPAAVKGQQQRNGAAAEKILVIVCHIPDPVFFRSLIVPPVVRGSPDRFIRRLLRHAQRVHVLFFLQYAAPSSPPAGEAAEILFILRFPFDQQMPAAVSQRPVDLLRIADGDHGDILPLRRRRHAQALQ